MIQATDDSPAGQGEFAAHPMRGQVLSEVHARPFRPLPTPARILHYAFLTEQEAATADRKALIDLCGRNGVAPPPEDAKHFTARFAGAVLRWEQHTEFTTYTWELSGGGRNPFEPPAARIDAPMRAQRQPGPLLVAVDLHLVSEEHALGLTDLFDQASLAAAMVDGGAALAATDFRADTDGYVRLLVIDRELSPARAGALAQRLIEIETYRCFALLGLPQAYTLSGPVRRIERQLGDLTLAMTKADGLSSDQHLLDRLSSLAAELESMSAAASYRFAASRAYHEVMTQRLDVIGEQAFDGHSTLGRFLDRRLGPAMRTCAAMTSRQAELADKLSRGAQLLRTRVDIEMERQNRDLLAAMNERTRLQLRLQQTVEGLSIAAVSYYVVGLAAYLFKGAKDAGAPIDPGVATALSVPVALVLIALTVSRARKRHARREERAEKLKSAGSPAAE